MAQPEGVAKAKDTTAALVQSHFEAFLEEFADAATGRKLYVEQIQSFRQHETNTIFVDFSQVADKDPALAVSISENYYRFDPYLRKAVFNLVSRYDPDWARRDIGGSGSDNVREFWVSWYGILTVKRLRELKTSLLGQLVAITGTVTRTSEVRPELLFGTFRCLDCQTVVKDVEQEFKYTELVIEQSKFVDWQKVRIQENANEVPSGCMPRSLDVILRNDMVEKAKAGDKVTVTGAPIVVPDVGQMGGDKIQGQRALDNNKRKDGFAMEGATGLKALGVRDLTYKISFLGCFLRPSESRNSLNSLHDLYDEEDLLALEQQFTESERDEIRSMYTDRLLMSKMVNSVCPHIFGHENVKKGILLQLLGGVHKVTPDGINIRGDLNVCVVGDPSCAKSQFLKYVSNIMPRAIYTSGKASSAAGLTASVMKDEETGEFTIEAGALMLADNGICCIDEFDKMDLHDQVAIHEAMEQQTISIAKAGIHATLNARTSILAAANPVNGRYDKKLSLKANINMSAPIMSRFDLFFIILDECDETTDYNIGRHIVNFHSPGGQENHGFGVNGGPAYSQECLLRYLKFARLQKPKLTKDAIKFIVTQYVKLRQNDATGNRNSYRITVRQLESMIRLSEALAKLHCTPDILVAHVKEAYNLLRMSIVHVDRDDIELGGDDEDGVPKLMRAYEVGADEADGPVEGAVGGVAGAAPASEGGEAPMDVDADADGAAPPPPGPAKFMLSFDEYSRISKLVVLRLKRQRDRADSSPAREGEEIEEGVRQSVLVDEYLEDLETTGRIETEAEYVEHRKIIKAVIRKLVTQDGTLLSMRTVEHIQEEQGPGDRDPLLMLHPNFIDPGFNE